MASRQRLEKKAMGPKVKTKPGYKQHTGVVGIPAHTLPINKPPHTYSVVIPNHAMPTSKYPYAGGNMHVPAHSTPINKQPIMNVPIHTAFKSKQQVPYQHTSPSMMPKISQSPVDVTMPSPQHGFWKLRSHASLDFDAHRQKIVSKKNQVAVSRRHLSPYLRWKKNDCFSVADVIEVPPELFQLKDLKDILNVEAWKGCLSPSERRFLRGLLPEGADYGSLVRALTRGDNFCFGNPVADWGKLLLKGEMNPDFVQQKELELEQAHKEHYQEVQNYHDKMLETLRVLKEEWILCKSAEKRLAKPKRRKSRVHDSATANDCTTEGTASRQKSKRQKVEGFQQASGRMDLPPAKDSQSTKNKLDKTVHHDDYTQSMHILKVTRKQYADVLHLMKGEGDELPVSALSSVLNYQQKIEIDRANGCVEDDSLKIQKCWSKLVEKDIPVAHAAISQRKADKERLAKSAAEQCLQYYSVFMSKDHELDLQSNSNAISPLEPEKAVPEFQKSIEADRQNSSASESSVTCLEEQAGTHAPVESCLSSVDCSGDILPQHLIQEEQVSLIDLPSGSSLVGEADAALLPVVQTERERRSGGNEYAFDLQKRSSTNTESVRELEMDTFSECNEGSVKHSHTNENLDVQETKSSGIELGNWDLHSKPGSEVVSAAVAAASGESEEVEQRVIHQSGGNVCNGLDDQLFCLSGPSSLLGPEETMDKGPLFCANYMSSMKNLKDTPDQVTHQEETYPKVNSGSIFQVSAPSMEEFAQTEDVHVKDYKGVFEMDQNQVDSEQNNQMMLHLFLDRKSQSGEFLTTEASSSQDLQGKNRFPERNATMALTHCEGEDMLKEHEPITELSLLVDDRSVKQNFLTEQADSVSSRTGAEFVLHNSLEPQWMPRHNKQNAQGYPFHQSSRELHHLAQSSQEAYISHSFTPMLPVWSNPQQMSHLSYTNHWNVDEGADQTNWVSADVAGAPFFSSSKDEGGRPAAVSHYWDQLSRGPCMNNWAMKQDQNASLLRRAVPDLQDEQAFQVQDNWAPSHSQPSTHFPYMWGMDRGGRAAAHPWKNASLFSHLSPQYEQQKVQNACLSKMNPNFTASWH